MFQPKSGLRLALVALLSVTLLACGGKEERKALYLEKARAYLDEGNLEKARIELKNVMQIDPKDAEARYVGGLVAMADQNVDGAIANLNSALNLNHEYNDAKVALARVNVVTGNLDESKRLLDEVLAVEANRFDASLVQMGILLREEKLDEGIALGEKLLAAGDVPESEIYGLLAGAYDDQGKPLKAITVMEQAVKAFPEESGLRMVLGTYNAMANKDTEAESAFRKSIELDPDNRNAYVRLSQFLGNRGKIDQGREVMTTLVNRQPDQVDGLLSYLTAHYGEDEAVAGIERLISDNPDNDSYRLVKADYLRSIRRVEEADKAYKEIIERDPESVTALEAETRLAELASVAGDYDMAKQRIARVLGENPRDNAALILRARLHMLDKDHNAAITDLRAVLRDQPENGVILSLLATAHQALGEEALAREALEKSATVAPTYMPARLGLARLYTRAGDTERALTQLKVYQEAEPNDLSALELQMQLQAMTGDQDGIKQTVSTILEHHPDNASAHLVQAQIHTREGNLAAARTAYEKVVELEPNSVVSLRGLAQNISATDGVEAAYARLSDIASKDQENGFAMGIAGSLALALNKHSEARSWLEKSVEQAPDWQDSWLKLADLYKATGAHNDAVAVLEQGVSKTSGSQALYLEIAELQTGVGAFDEAMAAYEKVLEQIPNHAGASNNLASLLVDNRKDQVSLDRALNLMLPFETSTVAVYRDTLGWVHHKRGDNGKALPHLQAAVESDPNSRVFRFHYGKVLHLTGDTAGAREHLEASIQGNAADAPWAVEARGLLAGN